LDGVGENCLRRQSVETVWAEIRKHVNETFSFKFQVVEPGWTITFVLDVGLDSCRLRLAQRYDYLSEYEQKYVAIKQTGFGVVLPCLDRMSADDLLHAVEIFLLGDMMNQ
jgi:hypothetical protein